MLVNYFGISIKPFVNAFIENIEGKDILVVEIEQSSYPILVRNKTQNGNAEKEFFARMNASTHQLYDVEEMIKYIVIFDAPIGSDESDEADEFVRSIDEYEKTYYPID